MFARFLGDRADHQPFHCHFTSVAIFSSGGIGVIGEYMLSRIAYGPLKVQIFNSSLNGITWFTNTAECEILCVSTSSVISKVL